MSTEVQESKAQKHLTARQRKAIEQANNQANQIVQRLVNSWYDFFLDNDPESEEVKAKHKEVSAKWKMYCKRRNLKAEVYNLVDESIKKLIEEYQKERAES